MRKSRPAKPANREASSSTRAAPPTKIDSSLGTRIRELRKARGLTMAGLGAAAGVSSGGLSQLEAGTIQPSLTTLRRIAAALDEPIFRFFVEPAGEPSVVVRATERRRVIMPGYAAIYELITPNFRGDLEVMEMRIEPGGTSVDVPLGHRGEECLVVLQGHASVQIGNATHALGPGDSATFRADLPHRTTNVGEVTLVMLSAMTPPSF